MASREEHRFVVAVVGATGAVGREILHTLETRKFPVKELRLLASDRSLGKFLEFGGQQLPVAQLDPDCFDNVNFCFFSAGGSVSLEYAPVAARSGAIVIDNSSAFRMDTDLPLVVPQVNGALLRNIPQRRIFPNANCSTIQLVMVLGPLHNKFGIRRVVVSTYQSTSGAGQKGMEELSTQVTGLYNYQQQTPVVFPHQIAFNVIPAIGGFDADGYCEEETKLINETIKILGDASVAVSATAVRVPTFHCHGESINVEFSRYASRDDVVEVLSSVPGVQVLDDPKHHIYPMANEIQGTDDVYVGRLRVDRSRANSFNLWVMADNLRKGAALNAVEIAEGLIR